MKNTKIKNLIFAVTLTMGLLISIPVLAAGFSLNPSTGSYNQNQEFSVLVVVNPQDKTIYTAKVELKYPSALLEVKSFTFSNNWLPLTQVGYNLIDNAGGTLIKTGGYAGGLSSQTILGIAVFKVKKSGFATIAIGNKSLILDSNSKNIFDNVSTKGEFTLLAEQIIQITKEKVNKDPVLVNETDKSEISKETDKNKAIYTATVYEILSEKGSLWLITLLTLLAISVSINVLLYVRFGRKR